MVARVGRYYGTPFKGPQGVTQGGPLSPTIFNMVVDAVINNWVTLVVGWGSETRRLQVGGPMAGVILIRW